MSQPHPHLRRAARTCRYCGARVALAMLDSGRRMPIDLYPDPDGTVAVRVDGIGAIRARVLNHERSQLEGTERLHVAHFATCGMNKVAPDPEPPTPALVPAYRERAREHQQETDEDDDAGTW